MPEEVAEELYRVLQQYNRERKDVRVVGGAQQCESDALASTGERSRTDEGIADERIDG